MGLLENISMFVEGEELEDKERVETFQKTICEENFDEDGKIYKRDFYRIEKIVNYWGLPWKLCLKKVNTILKILKI